jgi:hypothetical protein
MIPTAEQQPTMTGRETAPALGVSYASLMRAVAEDRCPVAFIKCGNRIAFVTADVRRRLHLDPPANGNGAQQRE